MAGQFYAKDFFKQGFWAPGFWANTVAQDTDESGLGAGIKQPRKRRKKYSEYAVDSKAQAEQISAKGFDGAIYDASNAVQIAGLTAYRDARTGQIIVPKGAWTEDDMMLLMLIAAADE